MHPAKFPANLELHQLMFAALIRAAESWRGLRFTEFELRQLDAVRKELDAEYETSIARSDRTSRPTSFQQVRVLATSRRKIERVRSLRRVC
jgi:hypothetical protein